MKFLKKCILAAVVLAVAGASMEADAAMSHAPSVGGKDPSGRLNNTASYVEGEAIILYQNVSGLAEKPDAVDSLGADISVEETYEFDLPNEKNDTRMRARSLADTAEGFCISLVKSEKYSTKELLAQLRKDPKIRLAEPNYRTYALEEGTDRYADYQWGLKNQGQNGGTIGFDIKPDQEVFRPAPDGKEYVIAMLDSGIDYTHEDLKDVVWKNPIRSSKLRGEHGFDFANQDADPMDDQGHGSHCAGIMAAAAGNGEGIRGVAGSNIKIMALKTLDELGSGTDIFAIAAYHYIYKAQQLGIPVAAVNNSWGGMDPGQSGILLELINLVGENGAVTVCAAGNEEADNDKVLTYPAGLDSEYLISVAASNEKDELAAFSNYGSKSVDLAAPGANILSTVSYDCFNPGLYQNRDELCSVYEDFSKNDLVQGIEAEPGKIPYQFAGSGDISTMTAETSQEAYFGLWGETEKSLKWQIKDAKEGDIYTIYLPYTADVSDTGFFGSIMVKAIGAGFTETEFGKIRSSVIAYNVEIDENGKIEEVTDAFSMMASSIGAVDATDGNYWSHLSGRLFDRVSKKERRALAISLVAAVDGDHTIYLDDFSISKENVKPEQFGKYDYFNGTSMAAPFVTGAVAAIAAAYPEESAKERIAHLTGCTRESAGLKEKTVTGGVLDLSLIEAPNAGVTDVMLDEDQNICVLGSYLSDASVTVNGQSITPKEQSNNKILWPSEEFLDRTLEIAIQGKGHMFLEERFFAKGQKFQEFGKEEYFFPWSGSLVSNGEALYYVREDGYILTSDPKERDLEGNVFWASDGYGYDPEIFDEKSSMLADARISNASDIVPLDGKLWAILRLEMMYAQQDVLACYDAESGWKKASALPEAFENKEGISIAAYQGKLYLLGGYDKIEGKDTSQVMRMDPVAKEWEQAAELPEGRSFARAAQAENTLAVMFGKGIDGKVPKTLLFDGSSWKVSAAEITVSKENGKNSYWNNKMESVDLAFYDSRIIPVKDGLICTGLQAENLGDTYYYQLSADQYAPSGYSAFRTVKDEKPAVALAQDRIYLVTQEPGKESSMDSLIALYEAPADGANIKVAANTENEISENIVLKGIRNYLPGDLISIEAAAEEGYFIKEFTVNGTPVAMGENGAYLYRKIADSLEGDLVVSWKEGAYVGGIFIEESLELSPSQSYQMSTTVFPENADNPKILWSSDNPKVVSVNKKGLLTVPKNAKANSSAVITATAADRKTVVANCIVTVTMKNLMEENTLFESGGLMYRVIKSSVKTKTATCMGFSLGSMQKVKIPSTVIIDGFTFQVTGITKRAFMKNKKIKSVEIGKNVASIGAQAFLGCTKLTSVAIQGTALKTVGSSAFGSIHGKAVIQVPKSRKKSFSSMLKKSGYLGIIK